MEVMNFKGFLSTCTAAGVGALLGISGCTVKNNEPAPGQGMFPSGSAGMSAPVDPGMQQPLAGTGAPMAGTGAPMAGTGGDMAAAGTGAPMAGSGGDMAVAGTGGEPMAGSGGDPMTASNLTDCVGGSTEPCGKFTTREGTEIPLGPYGAVMETNLGQGFETTVASGDTNPATCQLFAASFGEDPAATMELLDTMDLDFALYTVYRPANWVEGETYPIITWGNGTCAQPEGYGALLRHVASHGFFVVAANSRWVGSNSAMTKALDFAFAANADPNSPYYQKLDTTKVGAMGHSQGSAATASAASDSRVQVVILFNGGTSASKPFLSVSGDRDIGNPTATSLRNGMTGASVSKAAFLFYHMIPGTAGLSGHLTLMTQPERVVEPTTGWWKYMLKGDAEARELFVGASCGLCGRDAEFEFGQKGLD